MLEFHARSMFGGCIAYSQKQHEWGGRLNFSHKGASWDCNPTITACRPDSSMAPCDVVLDAQWMARFHNYTFVWDEASLDFFLDGMHVRHIGHAALAAKMGNPRPLGWQKWAAPSAARRPSLSGDRRTRYLRMP